MLLELEREQEKAYSDCKFNKLFLHKEYRPQKIYYHPGQTGQTGPTSQTSPICLTRPTRPIKMRGGSVESPLLGLVPAYNRKLSRIYIVCVF